MHSGRWRVELFGGLTVHSAEQEIVSIRLTKSVELLAYLALHPGRLHNREALASLFWPEKDTVSGRNNLRQALKALREVLETDAMPEGSVLLADIHSIRLQSDAVCVDVVEFEKAIQQASNAISSGDVARSLERACALYQGDLLAGIYSEWAEKARRQKVSAFYVALRRGVIYLENAGEYEQALPFAKRALELEPLEEEAHLAVMRLYAAQGQSTAIRRQLQELEQVLTEELGARPSVPTRSAIASLIAQADQFVVPSVSIAPPPPEVSPGETFPMSLEPKVPTLSSFSLSAAAISKKQTLSASRLRQQVLALVGAVAGLLLLTPLLTHTAHFRLPAHSSLQQTLIARFGVYHSLLLYHIPIGQPSPLTVWAMSPDGKVALKLADNAIWPRFSPDGRWLVFVRNKHILRLDVENGETLPLTDGFYEEDCPCWTSDGSHLFFLRRSGLTESAFPTDSLCIMNADGSHLRLLAQLPEPTNLDMRLSPDDKFLAYTALNRDSNGEMQIHTITADGKADHVFYHFPNSGPSWSRDGHQIACLADPNFPRAKDEGYYRMNRDGRRLEVLFRPKHSMILSTSGIVLPPDGEPLDDLLLPIGSGGPMDLYRMRQSDQQLTMLPRRAAFYSSLQWIPNPFYSGK